VHRLDEVREEATANEDRMDIVQSRQAHLKWVTSLCLANISELETCVGFRPLEAMTLNP
jgi:hypothetical protein